MLWICRACTTAFSVGAPKCPHCGSKKWCEQGSKEHVTMLAGATPAVEDFSSGEEPSNADS